MLHRLYDRKLRNSLYNLIIFLFIILLYATPILQFVYTFSIAGNLNDPSNTSWDISNLNQEGLIFFWTGVSFTILIYGLTMFVMFYEIVINSKKIVVNE